MGRGIARGSVELRAGFLENARGDFHGRSARLRVLRDEPVFDGGLRRRLHYSFLAFSQKRQRRRLRPPNPPKKGIADKSLELRASVPPNQRTVFHSRRQNGGFGGRSERRRLAEGQAAVSERSPPSQTKLLRVGRLLAPGANVQITACGLNPPCPRVNGPARNSLAHNSLTPASIPLARIPRPPCRFRAQNLPLAPCST